MKITVPKKLKQGDTIGIIAPAGVITDKNALERGISYLKNLGFNIKLSDFVYERDRYLAGSDDIRVSQINDFFADDSVDAIICARGGYGSIRILDKIDYSLIKKNPKIFAGFSDITALQLMIYKKTGLVTYSAPMICSDFGQECVNDYTMLNFFNIVMKDFPQKFDGYSIQDNKKVEGILWGGNLSSLVSLCGFDFLPKQSFIFFIEDLNEPVYKIDRMLQQLLNIKDFRHNIKGVVFGDFLNIDDVNALRQLQVEFVKKLSIPAIFDVKITHSVEKITLPIGQKARLYKNYLEF